MCLRDRDFVVVVFDKNLTVYLLLELLSKIFVPIPIPSSHSHLKRGNLFVHCPELLSKSSNIIGLGRKTQRDR